MAEQAIPEMLGTVTVPAAQVDEFDALGHTVVRGLASPAELAVFRPAIEDAVRRATTRARPLDERDTYGKAFLQVPNLCASDPVVRAFTFAARFARVAAELLRVDGVRLYHDQALFKEPGGGHTPWHQDQVYWPLDSDRSITMWMPLVDVPADVGSMTFVDGSHRHGDLGSWVIGDDGGRLRRAGRDRGSPPTRDAPGDATFPPVDAAPEPAPTRRLLPVGDDRHRGRRIRVGLSIRRHDSSIRCSGSAGPSRARSSTAPATPCSGRFRDRRRSRCHDRRPRPQPRARRSPRTRATRARR
jgi:hypothetical protein